MRLRHISEVDQGRRRFLKATVGTAVSMLTGSGLPQSIAKHVAVDQQPLFFMVNAFDVPRVNRGGTFDSPGEYQLRDTFSKIAPIISQLTAIGVEVGEEADKEYRSSGALDNYRLEFKASPEVVKSMIEKGYTFEVDPQIRRHGLEYRYGILRKNGAVVCELFSLGNKQLGDMLPIKNLMVSMWNNFARHKGFHQDSANIKLVQQLAKRHGGLIKPLIDYKPGGAYSIGGKILRKDPTHDTIPIEKLDQKFQEFKSEMSDYVEQYKRKAKDDQTRKSFDDQDPALDRWASEGGYTESLKIALANLLLS